MGTMVEGVVASAFLVLAGTCGLTGIAGVVLDLGAKARATRHLAASGGPALREAVAEWRTAPTDRLAFERMVVELRAALVGLPATTVRRVGKGIDQWNEPGRTRFVASLVDGVAARGIG